MSALELEYRLWSCASKNAVGTAYALPLLLILRAMCLGDLPAPDGNFILGIAYGALAAWNLGLWASWFLVRETIRRAAR